MTRHLSLLFFIIVVFSALSALAFAQPSTAPPIFEVRPGFSTTGPKKVHVPTVSASLYAWWRPGIGNYTTTGKATRAVNNGDVVAFAQDLSGNGNDLSQGTAGQELTLATNAINGQPAWTSSSTKRLETGSTFMNGLASTGFTIYIAYTDPYATGTPGIVVSAAGTNFWSGGYNATTDRTQLTGLSVAGNAFVDFTAQQNSFDSTRFRDAVTIITIQYQPSPQKIFLYKNGYQVVNATATGTPTTWLTGPFAVGGAQGAAGTFPAKGNVGQVLVYNTVHSIDTVRSITQGLAREYLAPSNLLMCTGNSHVVGFNQTAGSTMYEQLAGMVGPSWTLYNWGISGQTTTQMTTSDPLRLDHAVIPNAKANNVLLVWEITNDIGDQVGGNNSDGPTAIANLSTYCLARRAAGWKVIVCGVLPRSNSNVSGAYTARFNYVNSWLRDNWSTIADGFVDMAADSRLGTTVSATDSSPGGASVAYYQGDLIHLNLRGAAVAARLIANQVNTVCLIPNDPIALFDEIIHKKAS